ncbi:DUF1311 domain-containing protein [Rossellomorea vietnamensis]|uniref:DUF1311 domain-containing protein n=1 Tax=Rossellomorea vietnamensis TaxID=218284 RepID=A0A5D4MID7_9BACI|nr:lysozyme inhibitor LprI family protein [Rossellomorea vietnamensis]TYS01337.1 DUF1311 domain-containing protein [Rossellomorea vietnamensis]
MNSRKLFILTLSLPLLLAACGNSTEESNASPGNQNSDISSSQNAADDAADTDKNEGASESTPDSDEEKEQTEQSNTSDESSSKGTEQATDENETAEKTKTEYLEKLSKMEEEDRYAEAKDTMVEMEEQEQERFKKWDNEMNEIYGVLQEQLSQEEMDSLREEQREWVDQRDVKAKEASLKYEGGSTETLEYIATQATLTRERAYVLVSQYMK